MIDRLDYAWAWLNARIRRQRVVHCWADGDGSTCFRWDRHIGEHRWTVDSEITVSFPGGGS